MAVRIIDLPERERPRERLWNKGPEALTDRELLALVLRNGWHGDSALGLATSLLRQFGHLIRLANATPEELALQPGVGPAKAAAILAAFELARRLVLSSHSEPITDPEGLVRIARNEIGAARRERTIVMVLDAGNRLLRVIPVSHGSVDQSLFPVREVLNAVLRNDGRSFVVAHNHPSGHLMPSLQDVQATEAMQRAASTVGLRFLDHLIVTDSGWTSLRKCDTRNDHKAIKVFS